MAINNFLRDEVHENSILHGFHDNIRTYKVFISNLLGEFKEAQDELTSGRKPTEVYYNNTKPEGEPTELADIVIFILDYFGSCKPQIDVDEEFLAMPDEHYKNEQYYVNQKEKTPGAQFDEIIKRCKKYIGRTIQDLVYHENNIYTDENGEKRGLPLELHYIIKEIMTFCDINGIDIQKEIINKNKYNSTRPKGYRKVGEEDFDINKRKIFEEAAQTGGYVSDIIKRTEFGIRTKEKLIQNAMNCRKRRKQLEKEER